MYIYSFICCLFSWFHKIVLEFTIHVWNFTKYCCFFFVLFFASSKFVDLNNNKKRKSFQLKCSKWNEIVCCMPAIQIVVDFGLLQNDKWKMHFFYEFPNKENNITTFRWNSVKSNKMEISLHCLLKLVLFFVLQWFGIFCFCRNQVGEIQKWECVCVCAEHMHEKGKRAARLYLMFCLQQKKSHKKRFMSFLFQVSSPLMRSTHNNSYKHTHTHTILKNRLLFKRVEMTDS